MFRESQHHLLPNLLAIAHGAGVMRRQSFLQRAPVVPAAFDSAICVADAVAPVATSTATGGEVEPFTDLARALVEHCASRHAVAHGHARAQLRAWLRAMRSEPGWPLAPSLASLTQGLLSCLDEAMFNPGAAATKGVEANRADPGCRELENELRAYLDFRRLRRLDAPRVGVRFTRQEWQAARETEHELRAYLVRSGLGSYAGGQPQGWRFAVH